MTEGLLSGDTTDDENMKCLNRRNPRDDLWGNKGLAHISTEASDSVIFEMLVNSTSREIPLSQPNIACT